MLRMHQSSGSGLQPLVRLGAYLLVLTDNVVEGDVGEEHGELFPGDCMLKRRAR